MAQLVMRCLIACSIPAILCSAQIPASSIHGTVRDQTGAVIQGARVTVRGASSQQSTTSAADGNFRFERVPQEAVTLTAEAPGFAPFKHGLEPGDSVMDVVLAPGTVSQELSIAANRSEVRLADTAESVSILSRPALESAAALTLDDVLREVPGFTLFRRSGSRTANPTSQGVSLRGIGASGASRALVLYDGIPLNDPFGGWIYWGQIPLQSVDSVEVLQGGASSLYGSGALGGVVNILPLRREQNLVSLDVSGGSEETADFSVADSWKAGPWIFDNSGAIYRTSGYVLVPSDTRGTVDTPADSSHQMIQTTVRRMLGSAHAFAGASFYNEARDNGTPVQVNDTQLWQVRAGSDLPTRAGNFQFRGYGGGQRFNQTFSSIAVTRTTETLVDSQHVPAQQAGGSLVWSRQLDHFNSLVGGADSSYKRGFSDETNFAASRPSANVSSGGNQLSSGVFLQDAVRLGSRAVLTAGGRYDNWNNYDAHSQTAPLIATVRPSFSAFVDKSEHAFSPRGAVLLVASHHVTLTASGYKSFRGPALNELYRAFRLGNTVTLANSQLRAERLSGAESGANLSFGRARFHTAFFWMAVSDPIANVTVSRTPTLITNQRQNLGRTRSRGVEASAEFHYHDIEVTAGYQFVDAQVTSFSANPMLVGLQIPQVAAHQFTFQSSYRMSDGWSFALQGRAAGKQFEDDLNLLPLDSFFQLDAYVAKQLHGRLTIFAAAENLLNSRVVIGRTPVSTIGPPILARAGLKLRFP
jgi:outer membrane receptor protein involved in Fe transport